MLDMSAEVRGGSPGTLLHWWTQLHAMLFWTRSRHMCSPLIGMLSRTWLAGGGVLSVWGRKTTRSADQPAISRTGCSLDFLAPLGLGLFLGAKPSGVTLFCLRLLCVGAAHSGCFGAVRPRVRVPAKSRKHLDASGAGRKAHNL